MVPRAQSMMMLLGASRMPRLASAVALSAILGGCMLGRIGDPVEIEGVERETYDITLKRGEFEVRFARAGDESHPRAIFVHGTPGSLGAWRDYLTDPMEGVETVAIDRPGFGGTAPTRAVCDFAEQARALEPLLVQREGKWPILIGHSLGGAIVARAAAEYPNQVGAIVILAGSLDPALEKPRWFNRAGAIPLLDLLLPRSLRNSNKEIMAAPRETRKLVSLLEHVTCPVIIVHGQRDSLVPIENVEFMRQRFTSSEKLVVVELEHEGHFIPWTQKWLVRRLVERIARDGALAELEDRAPATSR